MRSFGFGLEAVGLSMLRAPRSFAVLVAISILICAAAIPGLRFDGNILNILAGNSEAFLSYRQVQRDFRDFSGDLGIIVRADDLYEPAGFEKLRAYHLDLTLAEGVEGVFSIFTSSRIDPETGAVEPTFPERIEPGENVLTLVRNAARDNALVAQLARPAQNAALISLETVFSEENGRPPDPVPVHALVDELRALAPPGLQVDFAGYPLMRADAVDALIADQMTLTVVGIVLVLIIAALTFRAPLPALICAMPALLAIMWVLGGYGLTGASINYLSTALPTIAMVLALADAIMLYFAWAARRAEGMANDDAIRAALRRVGPANAMTSITTAIAFASFVFGGNQAMRTLALLGSSAVMIAFLAVMVVVPLLLHFLGHRIGGAAQKSAFAGAGALVTRFSTARPELLAGAALAIALLLSVGHFLGTEQHRITNQLPKGSQSAIGEQLAGDLFGGVAPIYLRLPVPAGDGWTSTAALDKLATAERLFREQLGAGEVLSLNRLRQAGLDGDSIVRAMADAPDDLSSRFVSHDRGEYLVTGFAPYGMSNAQAVAVAHDVVAGLEREGIQGASVTGYPILASIEIPKIVRALKNSLITAILLGVLVIAVASRAPVVAAAALLPNLIPVLFIEAALWALGQPMDVPHVIALTIAFGISVDNAIHVINAFLSNVQAGMGDREAMSEALGEVTPALIAASLMFVAGASGTVVSSLPSVANMGFLIISTLSVALVSNLALLPALILTFRRLIRRGSLERPLETEP